MQIPMVNARSTFDKWELYRVLWASPEMRPHLPETRLYRGQESEFSGMLNRYGRVYLKSCRGSRGREVMQVSRLPGDILEYSYYDGRLFIQRASNASLPRIVAHFFGKADVIMQQPIDLISIADRKADLRAEMQRNGKGLLKLSACRCGSAMPAPRSLPMQPATALKIFWPCLKAGSGHFGHPGG